MTRRMLLPLATASVLLFLTLSVGFVSYRTARDPAAPPPDDRPIQPLRMAGVHLPATDRDSYDGEPVRESVRQARAIGARWVALNPTWYVSTASSCDLGPDDRRTVSDASLHNLLRDLDRMEVQTLLAPQVEVRDGTPRDRLTPADETCFFTAYRRMIEHYAAIAEATRTDMLSLGDGLANLTSPRHAVAWRGLASAARRLFSGALTYAADWGDDENAEFRRIDWWDAVDFIGVDAYFPLASAESPDVDPARAWRQLRSNGVTVDRVEALRLVQRRFSRYVILTQLGYRSVAGARRAPADATLSGPADPIEQASLFDAARRAWQREFWLEGVIVWMWSTDPRAGGPADIGYTIQGKPAADEVARWFQRE